METGEPGAKEDEAGNCTGEYRDEYSEEEDEDEILNKLTSLVQKEYED